MNDTVEVSVVIPVYNSEKSLNELLDRLSKVLDENTESYEVIFIDDGSKDNSWKLLEDLHSLYKNTRIIQLMKNFGQHNALMCGFNCARGEYIVTMDDDLQHPPEEIPKMLEAIKSDVNYDVIIGRPIEKKHSLYRNALSWAGNYLNVYFYDKPYDLRMGAFRVIRRSVINEIIKYKLPNPSIGPLLLVVTLRIKNITVDHKPRLYGSSTYTIGKLIKMSFDNIIHNSSLPLKIVSFFGIFISFLSFGLGLYYMYKRFFYGIPVVGWTTLLVSNLFLFGVVLFSFGIIGEYILRIVQTTQNNPQYTIRIENDYLL
jgi:glycosyltransferase involved in cell wall biosynthesis